MFETEGDDPSQLVPENLCLLFSSSQILKLGCGVEQDANLCHKYLGIECHGVLDLKDVHCLIAKTTRIDLKANRFEGLGEMVNSYLNKWLSGKGEEQMSNWSLPQPLSET